MCFVDTAYMNERNIFCSVCINLSHDTLTKTKFFRNKCLQMVFKFHFNETHHEIELGFELFYREFTK